MQQGPNWWQRVPSVRLLIPFVIGIILAPLVNTTQGLLALAISVSVCCLAAYSYLHTNIRFRVRYLTGLFVLVSYFSLGILICKEHTTEPTLPESTHYLAILDEPPEPRAASKKCVAKIFCFRDGVLQQSFRSLLYLPKESNHRYGDLLLFTRPLQPVMHTNNPGAFNYREWCLKKGIKGQAFLKENDYRFLKSNCGSPLMNLVFNQREWILDRLKSFIRGNKEAGLAEAILVGYKADLDKDLLNDYASTGVVHVIAISGLHLGIIYALLLFMTRPLRKEWLRFMFIIAGLWGFTLLSGAGPSVVRSAIMFSCIALSVLIKRKGIGVNTLLFSALLLLLFRPLLVWDAGFQLSYGAVGSLILFQQPIYRLLAFQNKLVDAVWQLVAVTTAAQILTLPFCLYHFHQFPSWFLVTNAVAVPLSSLILFACIILCIIPIDAVSKLSGWICEQLILLLNGFIGHMKDAPAALLEPFQLSSLQAMLLLPGLAIVFFGLFKKKHRLLQFGLYLFFLVTLCRMRDLRTASHQLRLIVYSSKNNSAACIIEGRVSYWLTPSLREKSEAFVRDIKPSMILFRVREKKLVYHLRKGKDYTVAVNPSPEDLAHLNASTHLIIIMSNKYYPDWASIQKFSTVLLVLDSTNTVRSRKAFQLRALQLRLPLYDVVEKGALTLNLHRLPLRIFSP